MTIEKLARFIVDDWYDGSPAGEGHQIAVGQEMRRLRENSRRILGQLKVEVEIDGE